MENAAIRRTIGLAMALVLAFGMCMPTAAAHAAGELAAASLATESISANSTNPTLSYDAELTFNDSGIAETSSGTGYSISGTTLKITAAGVYKVSGSCSEGAIEVAKELSGVVLVFDGLSLASSETAPLVVKKSSTVDIHLLYGTTSTLTNNEDPANETSSDTAVADAFEGAAVKVKSGSAVTFCGEGSLNVVANAKNGIKGGSTAALVFNQSGTVTVSGNSGSYATTSGAVNNGIASDGSVTFNQGTFNINAANDGIKSAPDATNATEGTTIDTESAGAVTINGGTFNINADGDGIQADTALTITAGTFNIKTLNGYNSTGTKYQTNGRSSSTGIFNADTMSCKGIKAAGDRAEEAGYDPTITISGGVFTIDAADDAVHSDAYATVTGGTFDITTGDDGMHADTMLTIGSNDGLERDPDIAIANSYEGLEGGVVNMYSGRAYIMASDDGINAAGGSSNGSDPFAPGGNGGNGSFNGGDNFKPGGNGGGMRPMSAESGDGQTLEAQAATSYSLNVYGGKVFVNCDGDGLDSNGTLSLTGGELGVFSMAGGGDNSPLDSDGTVTVNGATLFAAGGAGMEGSKLSSGIGQKYVASTSTYNANSVVNALSGSTVLASYQLPKKSTYTLFTTPNLSSTPTLSTASSTTACKGGSWSHSWNDGTTSGNVTTYTCSACGATERQTIATSASTSCSGHTASHSGDSSDTEADAGYAVAFSTDGHATVNVYYTQDYTTASATNVTSAVSRDSDTGKPDSSGSGQVNFTVVPANGYAVSSVSATSGAYKNIKGPDETGVANTYRITKVTGELTVTIETTATGDATDSGTTGEPTSTDTTTGNTDAPGTTEVVTPPVTTPSTDTTTSTATTTTTTTTTGKKANTMKVAASTKRVSSAQLVSKTKKVKALYVTNAKGTVKYTRVSGSKYLKVNKKTGKITVAKGTKAGTYKIKVKVRAAGNSSYKAKTVTKTVKVVVR